MRLQRQIEAGVSLIELVIGLAIFAILLGLAVPSFSEWVRNARLRSTAESLRADLQMARAEAIRRNAQTRLQFVTTLDASCTLSTSGPYWLTNLTSSQSPVSLCGNAPSATTSPYILQKSTVTANTVSTLSLTASRTTVGFNGLGMLTATTNPVSAATTLTVNITSSAATCIAAGGTVRCLRVVVSPSGDARICDPSISTTTDPLVC